MLQLFEVERLCAPALGSALCGSAARVLGLSGALCGAAQNSERRPDGTHGRRVLEGTLSATSPARACAQGAVRAGHASGRALSVTRTCDMCPAQRAPLDARAAATSSEATSAPARGCARARPHSGSLDANAPLTPWTTSAPRNACSWRFSSGACCLVSTPAVRLRCVAPVCILGSGIVRSGGGLGGGLSGGVSRMQRGSRNLCIAGKPPCARGERHRPA